MAFGGVRGHEGQLLVGGRVAAVITYWEAAHDRPADAWTIGCALRGVMTDWLRHAEQAGYVEIRLRVGRSSWRWRDAALQEWNETSATVVAHRRFERI